MKFTHHQVFRGLLAAILLLGIPVAQATQCIRQPDIWGYVEEAEYIFSARIVSISSEELERRPVMEQKSFHFPIRLQMQFDPITVIKGNVDELMELVTWTGFGIGVNFQVGGDYYFFVKRNGQVTACSATYELELMERGERADFLAKVGFMSPESAESARQREAFHRWELGLWEELNASDQPWLWALYLNNLHRLNYELEVFEFTVEQTINKLLTHPAPGADALYWATYFCLQISNPNGFCRTGELLDKLVAIDSNNLAVTGLLAVAGNLGISSSTAEHWNVPGFDEWLEQGGQPNNVETYQYSHFTALVQLLAGYGERHGFYSTLNSAPPQWRAIHYILDNSVFPGPAGGTYHRDCEMSTYEGRTDAVSVCRALAEQLATRSATFQSRSHAYFLMAATHPKDDARHIQLQREGNAWDGPVQSCLNRIRENENKPWSLNADANQFINEFEEHGEIAAFIWLARNEGWKYAAPDGKVYECEELPDLLKPD